MKYYETWLVLITAGIYPLNAFWFQPLRSVLRYPMFISHVAGTENLIPLISVTYLRKQENAYLFPELHILVSPHTIYLHLSSKHISYGEKYLYSL
jgi:hypothetical protein